MTGFISYQAFTSFQTYFYILGASINEKLHQIAVLGLKTEKILKLTNLNNGLLIKHAFTQVKFDLADELLKKVDGETTETEKRFLSFLVKAELELSENKAIQFYEKAITEFMLNMNTTRLVREKFMLNFIKLRKVWRQNYKKQSLKMISSNLLKYTMDADELTQNLINYIKDDNYCEVLKTLMPANIVESILSNPDTLQKIPYPTFFFDSRPFSSLSSMRVHCLYPNNLSLKNILRRNNRNMYYQGLQSKSIYSVQCSGNLTCPAGVGIPKLKISANIYIDKDTKPELKNKTGKRSSDTSNCYKNIEKIVTLNSVSNRSGVQLQDFKTVIAINQSDLAQLIFEHWAELEQSESSKYSKNNNNKKQHSVSNEKYSGCINVDIFTELLDSHGKEYFINTEYLCEKEKKSETTKSNTSETSLNNQTGFSSGNTGFFDNKMESVEKRASKSNFDELLSHAEKFNEGDDKMILKGEIINSSYALTLSDNLCMFNNVHSEFNENCRIRISF